MVQVVDAQELLPGELASRAGVAISALHFYERQGLITSRRTSGNQRRYSRDTLRRVAFIKMSQRLGIPLARVRDALATLPAGRVPNSRDWAGCPPVGAPTSTIGSCICSGCATTSPTASAAAA